MSIDLDQETQRLIEHEIQAGLPTSNCWDKCPDYQKPGVDSKGLIDSLGTGCPRLGLPNLFFRRLLGLGQDPKPVVEAIGEVRHRDHQCDLYHLFVSKMLEHFLAGGLGAGRQRLENRRYHLNHLHIGA